MTIERGEAYLLGFLPMVVGRTLVNNALVDLIESRATGDVRLVEACAFSRKAIHVTHAESYSAYGRLHGLLTREGAHAPPMPAPDGYEQWVRQVLASGRAAAADHAATFELGAAAGELYFDLWIARNLIYLRTASPTHAYVVEHVAQIARGLNESAQRFARTPESEPMRALLERRPDIATMTDASDFRSYFDWATAVDAGLRALGVSITRPE
jgi:hypothetical protein